MIKKANNSAPDFIEIPAEKHGRITQPTDGYPDPGLVNFYNNFKHRIIYLDHTLDDENLNEVGKMIIEFNREDKDIPIEERIPIRLYIYTYGGDLEGCLNFIQLCQMSKTPVYTYNMGCAFSAGFFILISGKKRFTLPSAYALFHEGSGAQEGTYEQIRANAEYYKNLVAHLQDITIANTSISKSVYTKKKKTEWFLSAEDQLKYGVVDEIITDLDDLL